MDVEKKWTLNAGQTAAYHEFRARDHAKADVVDDRTWSELEMDKVFFRLDRSITPLGAQYLFSLLRIYQAKPGQTPDWVRVEAALKADGKARGDLRSALDQMDRQDAADLAGFILGPTRTVSAHWKWYYLFPAVTILCLLGLCFSKWFLFAALASGLVNILVHHRHTLEITRHGSSLVALGTLLGTARKIAGRPSISKLTEVQELEALMPVIKALHKKVSRTFLRGQAGDDIFRILVEYLNLVLLFELLACCRALEAINDKREVLGRTLGIVGRLDALQGLASSLPEFPHCCIPEIVTGPSFALVDAYHPLLEQPVCNSLSGTGRSLLLSGTNMAGKTTFMKTLALNLLLSQTIGVCMARKAVLPPARVRTLISREENTTSGQSYFFFEASALLRMLKEAEAAGGEYWFVIDEIFRGTNTVERIAAGSAVLGHLACRWMVIASTHDDELSRLLASRFDSYHFSEVIAGKEARFDYLLKEGPCPTRNAIKLLVLAGYPAEVTNLAEQLTGTPAATGPGVDKK